MFIARLQSNRASVSQPCNELYTSKCGGKQFAKIQVCIKTGKATLK